jgi:hypothetical protein
VLIPTNYCVNHVIFSFIRNDNIQIYKENKPVIGTHRQVLAATDSKGYILSI